MPNTIRIKRRPAAGSAGEPSSLFNGELAFNENDNILYYGYGSGVGGAGVATSRPPIAGSGYYAHRGGTNASGLWPISVTGNSATVTNGVYTTGNQSISGNKTFSGNSSFVAENTSGNSVGFFAVFDGNPNSSSQQLKSVSKEQILDDIGAATSGLNIIAGSGLVGGGTLSQNRTFDIGQGDGVTVSADAIAVDSTVVRTTGTQTINGSKTFGNTTAFNNGISVGDAVNYLTGTGIVINWGDGGGILASFVNAANSSNNSINLNANTTFNRVDGIGVLPFTISPTGYSGSGAVTQGFWRGEAIEVNKGGTGRTSYSNGQLLIGSGTSLVANTLTQGDGTTITNGSGTIGIAVNSTVVRTTGNQDIVGAKSFYESSNTQVIFSTADDVIKAKAPNTSNQTYYFLGLDGGGSPPSSTSADRSLVSRSTSQVKTDLSLNNVTNDAQIKKITSSTSGNIPFWNGTTGDLLANGYGVETVFVGGTGTLPRSDAIKTYVDSMISSGIATNDAMIFKGTIDCSTNPNYPAADRGWVYKISVAGRIGGASGPIVEVNDTIICGTDGTAAGTHAVVGSNWNILQTNIVDASILVTGPSSATSGNVAMFDGATGKIIKDGGFLASDVARLSTTQTFTGQKTFGASVYFGGSGINNADVLFQTNNGLDIASISPNNGITVRNQNINGPSFNISQNDGTVLFAISGASVSTGVWNATTIAVDKGGTGQTSYTNGQLLIGNTTGNTLTKATLTEGTGIDIANGNGSITITHEDTSTLTGAQGSNGIASVTVDGLGHVTAVTTATYLTAGTVCAAIVDCALDGGSF